ncbi:tetratricopeptide repeat protein [Dactylosporangium sp. NPDC049525]|uniref:tetratricopeptide repeat protein n=1 Tax=Dactylosporangium sp. NPDC049525 TaxID=3154730 RepID=UPI003432FD82
MRIRDYGYDCDLDTDAVRACLAPWFHAIEAVCDRDANPDTMARMAILLRACGRTYYASFALCNRADAVQRVMFTQVVRAGTWRHVGNRAETAAVFRRALALEPANWSLYLDLADLAAAEGDFTEAAALATRGEELEPDDVTMRATAAAYRARSTGSLADLDTLTDLAPRLPEPYGRTLIGHAHGT